MLHPCQTQAVMQLLAETDEAGEVAAAAAAAKQGGPSDAAPAAAPGDAAGRRHTLRYLLAWLSVSGQPLGLGLPAQLWRQALA